jgi:hypothetical protein
MFYEVSNDEPNTSVFTRGGAARFRAEVPGEPGEPNEVQDVRGAGLVYLRLHDDGTLRGVKIPDLRFVGVVCLDDYRAWNHGLRPIKPKYP